MAALAFIAPIMTAVSTVLSIVGQVQQGNAAKQSADFKAEQYAAQAQEAQAAASRKAADQIRMGGLMQSRAQAVGAASGGSATDPTVVNIEGNIAGQSEYNALTSLWSGDAEAAGLTNSANAERYSGDQAQQAGEFGAITTGLAGGASMFSKYGEPSPAANTNLLTAGADINSSGGLIGGGYAGGYG